MRRILVDRARERNALKRGGGRRRLRLDRLHLEAQETRLCTPAAGQGARPHHAPSGRGR
jgi:hypothetical protein